MLILKSNQTGLTKNVYLGDTKENIKIPKKLNYGCSLQESVECDFSCLDDLNISEIPNNIFGDEVKCLFRWIELNWIALCNLCVGKDDHADFLEKHVPLYNDCDSKDCLDSLTLYSSKTGLPSSIRLERARLTGPFMRESQFYIIYDLNKEIQFYFYSIENIESYVAEFKIDKLLTRKEINLIKMWLSENYEALSNFYTGTIDTFEFIKAHKKIPNNRSDTNIFLNNYSIQ